MAKDGSLIFDTKIDNKGFQKGIGALKRSAGVASKVIATGMVAAAGAVAGIGIASAVVGTKFKASMSQVAATMGITVDEINKGDKSFKMLEDAAKDAGATTQFSASQAAEALNYLALAGYDAEKSVSALPTVLNLAAAGGLDLAYASDLVTDSMSALGLEMDELEGFTDELAKTSQKSNTSVGQLGEAILTVGGTAKVLAGGTVELNTALGILANNGIKGAEGGTALRNVILSLTAPTDKAAAKMKELGVEALDSEGNVRPLNETFKDLDKSLGDMSDGEKTKVLNEIFNKVDLKAVNALLADSGDEFNNLAEAIANSEGAAGDMAETMNANLSGQIKILKSALEGLGITIFEDMDSPLQGVVETLTGYVNKINDTLTAHDDIKDAMEESGMKAEMFGYKLEDIPNGFEGAAQVIGEIIADILLRFAEAAPKMVEVGISFINALVQGLQENLVKITESVVELIEVFVTGFLEVMPTIIEVGVQIITSLIIGISEMLPELIPIAITAITTIGNSIIENLPIILEAAVQIIMTLINGMAELIPELVPISLGIIQIILNTIIENLPLIIEAGIQLITSLVDGILTMLPEVIPIVIQLIFVIIDTIIEYLPQLILIGMEILLALITGIMDNLPTLINRLPEIIDAIINTFMTNLPLIIEVGLQLIMALIDGLIQNIELLVAAALKIIDSLVNFLLNNLNLLIDSALKMVMAIVDGLLQNLDLLIDAAITLVLAIIEGLIQSLPQLVNAGIQLVVGIIRGLLNAIPQLVAGGIQLIMALIGAIVRLIPQLIALGFQLIGELIGGILKGLGLIGTAGKNIIKTFISAAKAMFSGVVRIGTDLVKGIWRGITNTTGWILGKIKGFGKSVMKGIKSIFGIKSPSTIMRDQVGKNLTLGIGVGLEKGMPDLNREVDKEMSKLTRKMKATVDLESNDVGTKITATSDSNKYNVVTKDDNNKNNNENKRDNLITGNTFVIREEADIKKVARELYKLQVENERG